MGPVRVEIQGVMLLYLSGRLKDTNNFLHCDKHFFQSECQGEYAPISCARILHSLCSTSHAVNACKNARWYPDCSMLPMRVRKQDRFCLVSLAVFEKPITSCIPTEFFLDDHVGESQSLAPVPMA